MDLIKNDNIGKDHIYDINWVSGLSSAQGHNKDAKVDTPEGTVCIIIGTRAFACERSAMCASPNPGRWPSRRRWTNSSTFRFECLSGLQEKA